MRLIDADALFERAFEIWGYEADASDTNIFMEAINDAPTVDAALIVHARIEEAVIANGAGIELVCSACKQMAFPGNDFCPHCGAKFDLDIKEDR